MNFKEYLNEGLKLNVLKRLESSVDQRIKQKFMKNGNEFLKSIDGIEKFTSKEIENYIIEIMHSNKDVLFKNIEFSKTPMKMVAVPKKK